MSSSSAPVRRSSLQFFHKHKKRVMLQNSSACTTGIRATKVIALAFTKFSLSDLYRALPLFFIITFFIEFLYTFMSHLSFSGIPLIYVSKRKRLSISVKFRYYNTFVFLTVLNDGSTINMLSIFVGACLRLV